MSLEAPQNVLVVGRSTLDYYQPSGVIQSEYRAGNKSRWDLEAEYVYSTALALHLHELNSDDVHDYLSGVLTGLRTNGIEPNLASLVDPTSSRINGTNDASLAPNQALSVETIGDFHVGGGGVNGAALYSRLGEHVTYLTALGTKDPVSATVREHLVRTGMRVFPIDVEGFNVGVGINSRMPQSDREWHIRNGSDLDGILSDALIREALAESGSTEEQNSRRPDYASVSSLKKPILAHRLFQIIAEQGIDFSWNPGGSEFDDHPKKLAELADNFKPFLLALNNTELGKLFGDNDDSAENSKRLALMAAESYGQNILCTLGRLGVYLVQNGDVAYRKEPWVPRKYVHDTGGAGDAMHHAVMWALKHGLSADQALQVGNFYAGDAITREGAHSYTYPDSYPQPPLNFSLLYKIVRAYRSNTTVRGHRLSF